MEASALQLDTDISYSVSDYIELASAAPRASLSYPTLSETGVTLKGWLRGHNNSCLSQTRVRATTKQVHPRNTVQPSDGNSFKWCENVGKKKKYQTVHPSIRPSNI